jgi:hypothetical protein
MKIRVPSVAVLFFVATHLALAQSANYLFEPTSIVEGHPFSADLVITWQQQMPNAVPIRGDSHGKIYRDSKGRTRIESEGESPRDKGRTVISIHDLRGQTVTWLDPQDRTAHVYQYPPKLSASPVEPDPKKKSDQADADAPPSLAAVTGGGLFAKQITYLGSKQIEGITVTGTSAPDYSALGLILAGIRRPASDLITIDTWSATDLNFVLSLEGYDKYSNKRSLRLVNILLAEPSASLFAVPAGYTVVDHRTH